MLDTTLATEFLPGTNVKGEVAGANWLFLLPHINVARAVCFGAPARAALAALARAAGEVLVCADGAALDQVNSVALSLGLLNVRLMTDTLSLPQGGANLVFIADAEQLARFSADAALVKELQRLIAPDGVVYVEQPGLIAGKRDQAAIRKLAAAIGAPQRFWLTPLGGEMHTAIPESDRATTAYFLRYGLTSRSVNLSNLKRAVRARSGSNGAPKTPGQPRPSGAPRARRGLKTK
ncbi:hypothetical protein SE17_04990, partial [Kouleothrix aurantiaca]